MVRRKQLSVASGELNDTQYTAPVLLVDSDGEPIDIGGGGSGPVAWGDVTGKPSTFPPANHNHAVADVTGLQDVLDSLQSQIDDLSGGGE